MNQFEKLAHRATWEAYYATKGVTLDNTRLNKTREVDPNIRGCYYKEDDKYYIGFTTKVSNWVPGHEIMHHINKHQDGSPFNEKYNEYAEEAHKKSNNYKRGLGLSVAEMKEYRERCNVLTEGATEWCMHQVYKELGLTHTYAYREKLIQNMVERNNKESYTYYYHLFNKAVELVDQGKRKDMADIVEWCRLSVHELVQDILENEELYKIIREEY